MNMDKYFMWIHYKRLHNHNKTKHNKTVRIFLGIYCSRQGWPRSSSVVSITSVVLIPWTLDGCQKILDCIGSHNCLSPISRHVIIWANDGLFNDAYMTQYNKGGIRWSLLAILFWIHNYITGMTIYSWFLDHWAEHDLLTIPMILD